jgi:predicted ribosome quality control (RQC) complex YloA/Tae2 family protein
MNFDALTLTAVVDQLQATLVGGRIQHVVLPTPLSLGLEVYHGGRRHYFLASADPRHARVHLLSERPTRGVERDTPLLLLLRKYVRNGIIESIQQPPLERIMALSIIKHAALGKEDQDDVDHELRCELVIEVMGQRSNIILVNDDNLILDAVKRVPATGTARSLMPHEPYNLPPKLVGRRDPRSATGRDLAKVVDGSEPDLIKAIVGIYQGVSPQQAREAVVRAIGQPSVPISAELPLDAIAAELRSLWIEDWMPSVAYEGDTPIAFAPYHMQQYSDVRDVSSISEALETYYAATEQITAHAQRREALRQRLVDVRERLQHQLNALEHELERALALDQLRWEGEMIFGYLHIIQPGQTKLEVEGKTIKLDPDKTPVENAQERFRRYDKAKGALAGVPERCDAVAAQLKYLDETITLLELADSYEAIAGIEREVQEQGLLKPQAGSKLPKGPRSAPLRLQSSDGLVFYVGRTAGQNEEVTFRLAQPDDLWLHVRDAAGAHVVVRADGDVPNRTLEQAAGVAAYFSALRQSTSAEVVVTQRRFVRKIAGGPPGLVQYRNERTVRVAPLPPAELSEAGSA